MQHWHCIVVGKFYNRVIAPMMLCGNHVQWCNNIKYLGVHLETGKHVRFDIGPCKRAFYSACNSVFAHVTAVDELFSLISFARV